MSYIKTSLILLPGFVTILLFTFSCSGGVEMKKRIFSYKDLGKPVSYEEANNFQRPQDLKFEINDSVKVESSKLLMQGHLINSTHKNITIIVFPVGDVNPFYFKFLTHNKIIEKVFEGPQPPQQVPPPPRKVIIPPLTKMEFSYEINLENFNYEGTPTVKVEWLFHYWHDPIKGVLSVVLPPPDNFILKN